MNVLIKYDFLRYSHNIFGITATTVFPYNLRFATISKMNKLFKKTIYYKTYSSLKVN